MKKFTYIFLFMLLVIGVFSGCSTAVQTNLSPEVTEKIIQDYWNKYCIEYEDTALPIPIEWLSVRCYGIFEEVYVVFVDGAFGFSYEQRTDNVAGLKFIYPSTQELLVYRAGTFYTLQDAYDAHILTKKELDKLPKKFPENAFLELDKEKKDKINKAYYEEFGVEISDSYWLTAEHVGQWSGGGMVYLGSDNGYEILYEQTMLDVLSHEQIADQDFISTTSFKLMAHKDGCFLKLSDAYKDGLITKDRIKSAGRVCRMYYMAYWQKKYYHWYDWN